MHFQNILHVNLKRWKLFRQSFIKPVGSLSDGGGGKAKNEVGRDFLLKKISHSVSVFKGLNKLMINYAELYLTPANKKPTLKIYLELIELMYTWIKGI